MPLSQPSSFLIIHTLLSFFTQYVWVGKVSGKSLVAAGYSSTNEQFNISDCLCRGFFINMWSSYISPSLCPFCYAAYSTLFPTKTNMRCCLFIFHFAVISLSLSVSDCVGDWNDEIAGQKTFFQKYVLLCQRTFFCSLHSTRLSIFNQTW